MIDTWKILIRWYRNKNYDKIKINKLLFLPLNIYNVLILLRKLSLSLSLLRNEAKPVLKGQVIEENTCCEYNIEIYVRFIGN